LPDYEYVDMYCDYPEVEEGISWHLVLKNKVSSGQAVHDQRIEATDNGECVTVTAGACMGRPSPYNDLELDFNQHDVDWGQDGLWDEYDCFEQDEIEDPNVAEFLSDWTYDVRKYICFCSLRFYVNY